MISKFAMKFLNFLIEKSDMNIESEQTEIYMYGLECILNTGITVFVLMIWGIITNTVLETICWIVMFTSLRHHSGGLHAPTQSACIISSCILGASNWMILKVFSYRMINISFICIFCIGVCFLYAPTDTTKFELTEMMQKKEKYCSLLVLGIGFLIAFILKNSISISIVYSSFCVCILVIAKIIGRRRK